MSAVTTIPRTARLQRTKREANTTQKRERLKKETRAQLLERLINPQLTLHETAVLLLVSRPTVRRYADSGKLPCIRTQGGQRRFMWRDVLAYMEKYNHV